MTIGTTGIDAVRPRSVTVADLLLPNAEDRCELLLGEPPVALALNDRLVPGLAVTGGRMDVVVVDDDHRDGDGRRN